MRIAILTSALYRELKELNGRDRIVFDGAARYLLELCRLLQAEGHYVGVYQSILDQTITNKGGKKVRVNCGRIERDFYGIPVTCLPDMPPWSDYATSPYQNRVFNEISIYFDMRIYFATFLAHPHVVNPSISICHGVFWDYPSGTLSSLTEEGKREYFHRQMYGFTAPDVCVAVDNNVKRVISAMNPGSESRIHVISNFVDTEKFTPVPKTWDGINVLFPRRLTELRGCNEFIKASMRYPNYKYLAVGQSGDEGLEKGAAKWAKTTPHLRFIHREMDQMAEIYQGADISIVPTRASEGLSLSLLESMSCGLPVITTPVGGLGDAVIDGYNALVYDPNHDDLGVCINIMAKDTMMRAKFGQRNREIAQECFDIKIWKSRWKNLLRRF